ncbi:MAG: SirB1 family protein [Aquabacterium sp.]
MSRTLRFESPTPLQYFGSLVAEGAGIALLEAAVSIAQDEYPQLDIQAVLCDIESLGVKLKGRLPADAPPLQRLRLLNRYFFQELGFAGNVNDYYDRRNSYLVDVLRTRRGIPITLALLYAECAAQVGLTAHGVSFPGHFLVKVRMPRGEVVIDPVNGHSLSREDLDARLAPYRRRHGLVGDFDTPLGLFLQAATPRDMLARMLRNLKEIHRSGEDWPRACAVQRRLVLLLPLAWDERRDLALMRAELGDWAEAADDLALYLEHCPDSQDTAVLRQRLGEIRQAASRRFH